MDAEKALKLKNIAKELRKEILEMIYMAGSGHPGGSFSAAEIMACLFFHKMRYDPKNPAWPDRDRIILSKGHGAPVLYACLARAGFFPKADLHGLRKMGNNLQGHPSNKTSGVEISSGSLGQGLSIANGIALAGKLDKKDYQVYAVLGDGELQEGQVWEALMTSAYYKLDNITAIIDRNFYQQTGSTEHVMNVEPLKEKLESFGWAVFVVDGHSVEEIIAALDQKVDKPKAVIAKTVKGKGVSFMENNIDWHGKAPNEEEYKKAMEELA